MRRCALLILCLMLLTACLPMAAADGSTPKPIKTIPFDQLPPVLDGQHHYLLLCSDLWQKHGTDIGNTDGIVLVTLDTRAHRVMLTSFIRDALVLRPDGQIGRINYVANTFGPEELCRLISEHVGVRVEKFILFNFSQIQEIIDFLGGVDITVNDEEAHYLRKYAIPKKSTVPQMRGAGTYHFNGHAAVIYMRIRKAGGGGDFMRTQRVRTVLSTLADQCREITYEEARELVNTVMDNSTMTNMNMDMMVQAMEQAFGLRGCTVEELRIPPSGAAHGLNYKGMQAQELDWELCRLAMSRFLETSYLVLDEDDGFDEFADFSNR